MDKFYDDNYSKISDPEHIDVSNPTIQAGSAHFIILAKSKDAGVAVLAVGDNRFFQQGHPYPSSWTQARRVDFFDEGVSSVVKVACGDLHTAFLCADGAAYMSGSDAKGQCGGFSEQEPCMIDLGEEDSGGEEMDVLDVVCGASHTIAMATRGIYATGSSASLLHMQSSPLPDDVPKITQDSLAPAILRTVRRSCGFSFTTA